MMQTPPTTEQPPQAQALREEDLVVEAALFSAGRPLALDELADQTGLTQSAVKSSLPRLKEAYRGRQTSLDIVKSGQKWALALRAQYAEQTRHIVPPEVPRHVVRTLALIAYHQPILQSDLKDMVGSKVYEHVGHLVDAGMVRKSPDGLTYRLSTTEDFPEYFGIPANDAERIRRFLAEKVGLVPKQEPQQTLPQDDPAADGGEDGETDGEGTASDHDAAGEADPVERDASGEVEPVDGEMDQDDLDLETSD